MHVCSNYAYNECISLFFSYFFFGGWYGCVYIYYVYIYIYMSMAKKNQVINWNYKLMFLLS